MAYQEIVPNNQLRPYVRSIWHIEEDHSDVDSHESATPDSYIEVIFNAGDPCYLENTGMAGSQVESESTRLPEVFLVGLQNQPLSFRTSGITQIVGIRFYVWGILPLTGLFLPPINTPPVRLTSDWLALLEIITPHMQIGAFQAAAHLIELFLIDRLNPSLTDLNFIHNAGNYLYGTHGQTRIDDLADYCRFSTRQLERQFKALAGVSPKYLARSIRFEQIALRLFEHPSANLLDLVFEFGYTDQAHFIRDFKAFAHMTPGEFAVAMQRIRLLS